MHELLILSVGITVGMIITGCAVYLGGHLVLRTYMELTNPHLIIENKVEEDTDTTTTSEGYDWDQYEDYLRPPRDENGEEPDA